jgi:hypothetical protein
VTTSLKVDSGFQIAIRIWHPKMLPESISQAIGRRPDVERTVGSQRTTPKGTPLPGRNEETFWLLNGPVSRNLPVLIDWANDVLQGAAPFLKELRGEGGKVEYSVGCFLDKQLGTCIDLSRLEKCVEIGATLSFDMYGKDSKREDLNS